MKIQAITCGNCGDTIFSRTRHDYRSCSCGAYAIDGGFDYIKLCGNPGHFKGKTLHLKVSKKTLFEDWANRIDKYGLIKGDKKCQRKKSIGK